jgi:hypothetical protein
MKTYIIAILCLVSVSAFSQGVDSTRIPQTITLQQKYHVYCLGFNQGQWGQTDYINYLNDVRKVYSEVSDTVSISVTVPSSLVRDLFYSMSRQPEGEATQYNEEIQAALGPQITNPWLGAQVNSIVQGNWDARDARIEATKKELIKIKKVN